ncbi:hypothetical protein BDM02DRAFT_2870379 [Thelephora ganbajun]|uniref:Uncharacterized protein n=1 Tax=Thelephora ganbajun TaxID=370292 RepID=A0ACB6ZAY4_THEGA|nr:hypothetical protein BDM02DRAFT_2870379 [Thelephora ganbajun]
MFHGDLKGGNYPLPRKQQPRKPLTFSKPNILIDDHGHVHASDFGLTSIAHDEYSTRSLTKVMLCNGPYRNFCSEPSLQVQRRMCLHSERS